MTPTPARRVMVVLVLVAALLAAVAADRLVDEPQTKMRALPGADMPEAHPASSLSSTWFCPGGPADGGALTTTVRMLNPTDGAVQVTLTVMPNTGEAGTKEFELKPGSAQHVVLKEVLTAPWAAALVDVDGGGIVVEESIAGAGDFDSMPCAPSASGTWYFASGSTARDATLTMLLFNPFPDDAIVDMAFATGEGRRVPGDFEGLVVPAGSVLPVDIGAHVRRQDFVSSEVKARAGRVAAGQVLVRTGQGVSGVSTTLGAPSLAEQWVFPDGIITDGVAERFELFNPTDKEARVDIEFALDEGEVEPFEVTIPAQGRFSLDVRAENRVPKNIAHAAVAQSINGVPVVVSRVIESTSPRQGRSDMLGARRPDTRWAMPYGFAGPGDEWVSVFNPSPQPMRVSVTALADGQLVAVEGMQDMELAPGRRLPLRLTDHIKRDSLPLIVQTTRPAFVERALYTQSGLGASIAIPFD